MRCAEGSVLTGLGCFTSKGAGGYHLESDQDNRPEWVRLYKSREEFCGFLRFTCTFFEIGECVVKPKLDRLIEMANAKLSSDFSPSSNPLPYPAENCLVDSGENSSMCVSNSQPNPSWTARTADDQQYDISAVIVRNRADCLGTRAAIRAFVFLISCEESLPARTKC